MFNILSELGSGHRKKTQMSNNALKETKALVNSCLNEMSEITGRALGRWRNMSQASIDEYEKIAYMQYLMDSDYNEELSLIAKNMINGNISLDKDFLLDRIDVWLEGYGLE